MHGKAQCSYERQGGIGIGNQQPVCWWFDQPSKILERGDVAEYQRILAQVHF